MTRAERVEAGLLVVILLVVGAAAGWASFTHVHDWTMANSPTGTPNAFGWVNACVSELVPVASLLEIRRRRRTGAPTGYPLALLIGAACLSLAAQLAVAKPGLSGWLLSAVPALAFMALVKLVFARTPAAAPAAEAPAPVPPMTASAPVAVPVAPAPRAVPAPVPPRPPVVPPGARPLPIVPARVPARRTARNSGGTRTDADLRRILADPARVPRRPDGSVPVKVAARALGTGVDRARRLLDEAGLRAPVPASV